MDEDADWTAARRAFDQVSALYQSDRNHAEAAFVRRLAAGTLKARATAGYELWTERFDGEVGARVWVSVPLDSGMIPIAFWQSCRDDPKYHFDWATGDVTFESTSASGSACGVIFEAAGIQNIVGDPVGSSASARIDPAKLNPRGGRKPTYDWLAATNAVWGAIYRGDLQPSLQADVERAMIGFLTKGDDEPSESTVRPYASRIWYEVDREA